MCPRMSKTSNQSRLRRERDAEVIAVSIASETDLSELPTISVFTYVRLAVIRLSLLNCESSETLAPTSAELCASKRENQRPSANGPWGGLGVALQFVDRRFVDLPCHPLFGGRG